MPIKVIMTSRELDHHYKIPTKSEVKRSAWNRTVIAVKMKLGTGIMLISYVLPAKTYAIFGSIRNDSQ